MAFLYCLCKEVAFLLKEKSFLDLLFCFVPRVGFLLIETFFYLFPNPQLNC